MYTQTSEAIKGFKNQNDPDMGVGSGSQTSAPDSFGGFDKDFAISSTVNEIEQPAHHVRVNVEDNLSEPHVNIMKDNLAKPQVDFVEGKNNFGQQIKESISDFKSNETINSQTINLDENVKSDHVTETVHKSISVDKLEKVDGVSSKKVDFNKVGDIGLAGPKISMTENVVDSFKSAPKQPKQPKPKSTIMSNFKPQVRFRETGKIQRNRSRGYRKIPKNLDTQKIARITLKLDQYCFTTE